MTDLPVSIEAEKGENSELAATVKRLSEENEALSLAVHRTRLSVKRLRLEYGVLLERLESRVHADQSLKYESPLPNLESFKKSLLESMPARTHKKKGKSKDKRDPNLPKRPTNAYILFCEMNKDKVKEMNENADMTRLMAEIWNGLDEEAKKPYYDLYNEGRQKYEQEMSTYSKKKATQETENTESSNTNENENENENDQENENENENENDQENDQDNDNDGMDIDSDVTQQELDIATDQLDEGMESETNSEA